MFLIISFMFAAMAILSAQAQPSPAIYVLDDGNVRVSAPLMSTCGDVETASNVASICDMHRGLQMFGAHIGMEANAAGPSGARTWSKATAIQNSFSYPPGKYSVTVKWDSANNPGGAASSTEGFPCDVQVQFHGTGDARPVCHVTAVSKPNLSPPFLWTGQEVYWTNDDFKDTLYVSSRHYSNFAECANYLWAISLTCHVPL